MKNILKLSLVSFASLTLAAGCIQETFPQTSYVTTTQAQVPGAIDRFVDAITATLCGFPNRCQRLRLPAFLHRVGFDGPGYRPA